MKQSFAANARYLAATAADYMHGPLGRAIAAGLALGIVAGVAVYSPTKHLKLNFEGALARDLGIVKAPPVVQTPQAVVKIPDRYSFNR